MTPVQRLFDRVLPGVRILYGALVFSTVLIAGVSFKLGPTQAGASAGPPKEIFFGLAAAMAVLSLVLPRIVAANNARNVQVEIVPAGMGPAGPTLARFGNPLAAAQRALPIGQVTMIVSLALSEAVSLFGLVLRLTGGPLSLSIPFFAAGTLLAAIRFPTIGRLVRPFERAHGATFEASRDGVNY